MLISKFNRLIHNKWLWTIFASIVIFTFVVGAGLSQLANSKNREAHGIGTIAGQEVDANELYLVKHFLTRMRGQESLNEEEAEQINRDAWEWIAAVRTAREMGFVVGDAELARQIRSMPLFGRGGYNETLYGPTIQVTFNSSVPDFEHFMGQSILIQKLMACSSAASWVHDVEVAEETAIRTDRYTIQMAELPRSTNLVDVSDEEIVTFYEANTNRYVEPERVSVAYTRFAFSNYLDKAQVETNAVENYYVKNIDEYTTTGTNGLDTVQALTNVQDQIFAELQQTAAVDLAADAADELLSLMLPGRGRPGHTFWAATRELGLNVSTTRTFVANGYFNDLDVNSDFTTAAFELDFDDPTTSFSDMIAGTDHLYVIAPVSQIQEHVPALDEIREDVKRGAIAKKRADQLNDDADAALIAVKAAIEGGANFTNAIAQQAMSVVTSVSFTAMGPGMVDPPFAYSYSVAPSVQMLNPGDFADPIIAGAASSALIIQLVDRVPGEPWARQTVEAQVRGEINRNAATALFTEWRKLNLDNSGFFDSETQRREELEKQAAEETAEEAAEKQAEG